VGKKTGKNPTDRGKLGVKRSVITDRRGVPLGVAIDGANAHDVKLLRATLQSMPLRRPKSRRSSKQHLCLDKGYFGQPSETLARRFGYVPHIPPKGQAAPQRRRNHRARRWVVEGSHSWANRARRLLVRWEKKAENYLAFVHVQFAYIALKQSGVMG
jgi:putative transposase